MIGQSTISAPVGDDTIELELTSEQLLDLARAAEVPEPLAPAQIAGGAGPGPIATAFPAAPALLKVRDSSRDRPSYRKTIVKMAGAILAYAAFAWWSALHFAAQPQPAAIAEAKPTVIIPRPVLIESPAKPAVRVVNPFDASEVFEFPSATTPAQGREKVAQTLLQRARERQSQWIRVKPAANVRTASLERSP